MILEMIWEVVEKMQTRSQRRGNIFHQHRLIGMMADAAGIAQEDHRCGDLRGYDHRIVAGAAGHVPGRNPRTRYSFVRKGDQSRVQIDSGLLVLDKVLHFDLTPVADS